MASPDPDKMEGKQALTTELLTALVANTQAKITEGGRSEDGQKWHSAAIELYTEAHALGKCTSAEKTDAIIDLNDAANDAELIDSITRTLMRMRSRLPQDGAVPCKQTHEWLERVQALMRKMGVEEHTYEA